MHVEADPGSGFSRFFVETAEKTLENSKQECMHSTSVLSYALLVLVCTVDYEDHCCCGPTGATASSLISTKQRSTDYSC